MALLAQRTYCLVLLVAGALVLASPAAAQQPSAQQPSPTVQRLAEGLRADQEAHLWRVALWGGLNVAGGLALWGTASRSTHPARWSFGGMSAGWGLVNVGIAAFGGLSLDPPAATAAAALSAERTYHDILLLNLGLNVGYMGVGGTMLAASARDVASADEWRGAGYALLLQGAGLLALDGIAFVASRSRLGELLGATTGHLSVHAVPTGVTLTVLF